MKDEIIEVTTYKTADGVEHPTRGAAEDHIKRKKIIEEVTGCIKAFREELDMDSEEEFTDDQVKTLIYEHFETLGQLYLELHEIDVS